MDLVSLLCPVMNTGIKHLIYSVEEKIKGSMLSSYSSIK